MKEKPKSEEAGCPLWMLSFGDTMSLLVTFFIMLLSFSEMEEAKLLDLIGAMKGGLKMSPQAVKFSGMDETQRDQRSDKGGAREEGKRIPFGKMSAITPYEMMLLKQYSRSSLGDYDKGYFLKLLDQGLTIIVHSEALFKEGTAEFLGNRKDVFGVIADLAGAVGNEVRIIGVLQNDSLVLSANSRTPWGLALERAEAVKNKLSETPVFTSDRFSIGARIEPPLGHDVARSQEIVEIILVGYYDLSRVALEDVVM